MTGGRTMAAKRDYYDVLGISRSADKSTIKRAYRKLAKKYHPDTNAGNAQAEEKFKEATEAYNVLSDPEKKKSHAYNQPKAGAKEATLEYKLLGSSQRYYLLEVKLYTGRHHQIRCQLAKIGCPIKGDLKYGFPRSIEGGGISLHARSITFKHPVSREMITITAKPPLNDPLWKVFYEGIVN